MQPAPAIAGKTAALRALLQLLRPPHWLKNGFVLAPLLFSRSFHDVRDVEAALWTVLVFSLASSAVYVGNDLRDAPHDRKHPRKRLRPIASGAFSPRHAGFLLLFLLTAVLLITALFIPAIFGQLFAFLALNAAYTVALKRVPWVDLATLSAGFLLRVDAGAAAIQVELSPWMLTATLALAFFMASLKRYSELMSNGESARPALVHYRPGHLRWAALASGAFAVACYTLFVALVRHALLPTLAPVLFGMFRYFRLVTGDRSEESPLLVLSRDPLLLAAIALWAGGTVVALW